MQWRLISMYKVLFGSVILVNIILFNVSCSNVPTLSNPISLSTEAHDKQYFYCKSCATATKLSTQDEVLVPDVIVTPQANPQPAILVKPQVTKHKKYKKSLRHRVKTHKHMNKQCLKWSI